MRETLPLSEPSVSRLLSRFVRFCTAALLVLLIPALAAAQSPTVTLSPRDKLITNVNREVIVTVDFCDPTGAQGFGTQWVKLNDVDIWSQFVQVGPVPGCTVSQRWQATITLDASPVIQTLDAFVNNG